MSTMFHIVLYKDDLILHVIPLRNPLDLQTIMTSILMAKFNTYRVHDTSHQSISILCV